MWGVDFADGAAGDALFSVGAPGGIEYFVSLGSGELSCVRGCLWFGVIAVWSW